ncbi:cell division protein ZapE [Pseudomonas sp. MYb185]|uniref:cell division protein ZapE n=1 Tax=Pseudomonas sp. MYb185 TaxID=1848729 RepID=UPI000CFBE012|nr:cell division protein ZapE [Pseudomonas sp. MYb185]PRB80007.1 cell division protein ZapE [Pseudomonas sp. MYb185]
MKTATFCTPLQAWQRALDRGFIPDAAQYTAVQTLEALHQTLHDPFSGTEPVGVYLWGPVGRGKTWLMDSFHNSLQVPSRRQHFHHFMQWVHRRLFELTGSADPLAIIARELAAEVRVLCFDELFINDIGDASILGRLFLTMFAEGMILVATSNQPPQQLYEHGHNRERLLPALAAIEQHMQVFNVDGGQDHRLHPGHRHQRYWVQDTEALAGVFDRVCEGHAVTSEPLQLNHQLLRPIRHCPRAIWFSFTELCERPLAASDFMALCDSYPAILLGDVPALSSAQREARIARGTEDAVEQVAAGDRVLPPLSRQDDSVRRLIALVDECYDRRVPLYIEAAVPLTELYTEGALLFPFRRTLSRLQEMQLERF